MSIAERVCRQWGLYDARPISRHSRTVAARSDKSHANISRIGEIRSGDGVYFLKIWDESLLQTRAGFESEINRTAVGKSVSRLRGGKKKPEPKSRAEMGEVADPATAMAYPTGDEFALHVDSVFRAAIPGADELELTLSRVESLGDGGQTGRKPFSLLFLGPAGKPIPQCILAMTHPVLGALDIFVVPIGPDAATRLPRYEAIFN